MIIDFLETKRPKEELRIALEVLKEFKDCEGENEWYLVPSAAWAKLEQLMKFLEYLVNGKPQLLKKK